jgi:hypothetical protein
MTVQSPVPLRPDVNAMRALERRRFMRAPRRPLSAIDREDPAKVPHSG